MKRKAYLFLVLVFFTCSGLAQSFSKIDKYALKAPQKISKDLPELTKYLIHNYTTDLEKVRSFYTWMAHNINYDGAAYKRDRKRINQSNADVLARGEAVCFGYATLFKEMCEIAGIPCEVIFGYPKNQTTGLVNLSSTSHAWNSVLIDGEWHLLDLTWGTGNDRKQFEHFFLPSPEEMIFSHLPADPMWQLLDCPLAPGIFRKAENYIKAYLATSKRCFNYRDSIEAFLKLSPIEKKLKQAKNAYLFNPANENKLELGHTYMDQVSILIDRAEALELTDSIEAIKAIHLRIITTCKKAEQYIDLYDHQKENLAYSYINYGIALSKEIQNQSDPKSVLDEMLLYFESAKEILEVLPKNFLSENALLQIDSYLEWVRNY